MRHFLSIPALLVIAACGDAATEPQPEPQPDPVPASVQADSVWHVSGSFSEDTYGFRVSNHGNQPGAYKVEAWGIDNSNLSFPKYLYGQTDQVQVTGDYEESYQITVHEEVDWFLFLTRSENSAVYAVTDSVHVGLN